MTWEWVTLILGIILLIICLFCFIAWTQMEQRVLDAYPKADLADMPTEVKREGYGATETRDRKTS